MKADQLKPNYIIIGPLLPELVKIFALVPIGDTIKLVGNGLRTDHVYDRILNLEQKKQLG